MSASPHGQSALELGLGFELGLGLGLGLATRATALQESPCRPRVALWAQELSLSFAASMTQRGSVPARLLSRLHHCARPYLHDVCQTGIEPRTSAQPDRFTRLSLALDRIFELVFTFNPSKTNALMHSVPFIGNQTSIVLFMISQVVSTPRAHATTTHTSTCHTAQLSAQLSARTPARTPAQSPSPSPDQIFVVYNTADSAISPKVCSRAYL